MQGLTPRPRERCVLLKVGESILKRRNRGRFCEQLERNVRRATRGVGPVEVRRRGGVLVLATRGSDPRAAGELLERVRDVVGVSLVHPALSLERTPEAAASAAIDLLRDRPGRTFAVRARRRDKRFPIGSQELAALVGRAVQEELGLDVDLERPHLEIYLEIDRNEIFAYTERLPGRGGLPVGVSGRAVALLSGGIDSPVAAYRMMKRGLRLDFAHFTGRPFTGPESTYKAYALVARLDRFQGDSRLFVVPFGLGQRELATAGAGRLQVLAQRRLMLRVAEALARRTGAEALVTGDSLGQVSSQTLRNLAVVQAATELPLLRPLIGHDKAEITSEAAELGTLDISTLPDEDCCTLFASPLAATRADPDDLARLEARLDLVTLVERLAAGAELVRPRPRERIPVASAST